MNFKYKKNISVLFKLILGYLISSIFLISYIGLSESKITAFDIILVLGNKIEKNGNLSPRLVSRCERAIEIYNEFEVNKIIVSGGIDRNGNDEAFFMKKYLVSRGIDPGSIIEDNKGSRTELTILNLKLMNIDQSSKILVSTQFYHIPRTILLFKFHGFKNTKSTYSRFFEIRDVYSVFRESIAIPYYTLKYLLFE